MVAASRPATDTILPKRYGGQLNTIDEYTKRVMEFYGRACPRSRISVHIVSAAYLHEGRTIRDGEYTAKVVVVDPVNEDKILCVLAAKDGNSPNGAVAALFDSYSGPISKAVSGLEEINATYVDLVVVKLCKEGTKIFVEHRDQIEKLRSCIYEMKNLTDKE